MQNKLFFINLFKMQNIILKFCIVIEVIIAQLDIINVASFIYLYTLIF